MTSAELDAKAHPWPAEGKLIGFRLRRGVWVEADPMYNQHGAKHTLADLRHLMIDTGTYPFLTWNFGTAFGLEVKGYIGWKPISPTADPAFFWRDLRFVQEQMADGALFVQLSVRGASAVIAFIVMCGAFVFGSYHLAREFF